MRRSRTPDQDQVPALDHIKALLVQIEGRLEQQIVSLDALTDAKFVTFRTLIDSQAEKVALALASADKAVTKAEAATEKRFEGVNEFRQTLSDQASTFVNRDQYEATRELMGVLAARIDKIEARGAGLAAGWGYLIGAVGLAATVIAIIVGTR